MDCIIQYSIAFTIAQFCRNNKILFAQDPDYTEIAEEILIQKRFKIIGIYGAEGFSEIDKKSIIILFFAAAPVKQIIADLARSVFIISIGFEVFNSNK